MNMSAEERLRLAEALDAASQELVRRIVERLTIQVEDYRQLDAAGDQGLSANTTRHLRQFTTSVRNGTKPRDTDGLARDLAMVRARLGLPLSSIMRAFHKSSEVLWEWFAGLVEAGEFPKSSFSTFWPMWLDYVDEATQGSAEAYSLWERQQSQEQANAATRLMAGIVRGDLAEIEGQRLLQAVGLDLGRGVAVSVVRAAPLGRAMSSDLVTRLDRSLRVAAEAEGGVAVVGTRDSGLLVLHAGESQAQGPTWLAKVLTQVAPGQCFGATSEPMRTVRALIAQVRRTERASRAAVFQRRVLKTVDVQLIDHGLVALQADLGDILPGYVRVLDGSEGVKSWRPTVIAWAESSWRPSHAAKRLGVHANTVYYRLAQVELKTGLDLHDAKDAMSLYLAARLQAPWSDPRR